MLKLTTEQLSKIVDPRKVNVTEVVEGINRVIPKYKIDTPLRLAHWLAQICHESLGLTAMVENLNYSAARLMQIFPKYFPTLELANQYARKPTKIANKVYANRIGNGNEASGDGYKYRGRGYIQLTGRSNYLRFGNLIGVDLVNNPDLAKIPSTALEVAAAYWSTKSLWRYADCDDINAVTRAVNGGYNGLSDRKIWLTKCKRALGII